MSKNSAKSMYVQLMEWVGTLKKPASTEIKKQPSGKFSKGSYYKEKGV
jgi:hypothetical protein